MPHAARSSSALTSNRWCSPVSFPISALIGQPLRGAQPFGFAAAQQILNIGWSPNPCRRMIALWAAPGKQACSGLMGAVQRVRISVRPRFFSGPVCAQWGGKVVEGEKAAPRRQPLGQGLAQFFWLALTVNKKVTSSLLHDLPSGLLLGVQSVDANQATGTHRPAPATAAQQGFSLDLVLDQLAAAIILAGGMGQRTTCRSLGVPQALPWRPVSPPSAPGSALCRFCQSTRPLPRGEAELTARRHADPKVPCGVAVAGFAGLCAQPSICAIETNGLAGQRLSVANV